MAESALDPVSLEIVWHRLIAIADEAAITLVRTSFSPIVRESNDFSCVVLDPEANVMAENTLGIPSFNMTIGRTLRHFLRKRPAAEWRPGDVGVTNDPWLATGHLPDVTILMPVFAGGRIVAWVGSIAHQADIGGAPWAADAAEVFEEGLRLPLLLLARGGELNQDVLDVLRANVRLPDEVVGDVLAQMAAGHVAAERLGDLLADAQLPDLDAVSAHLRRLADRAMREALAAIPDGVYESEVELDGTEAGPQVRAGVNCPFNYTEAYTCYPLKCAIDPVTPRNEGSYACFRVSAPPGSILNPSFPAPVNARHMVGHCLSGAVFQALAPVLPESVIAESGAAPNLRAVFVGTKEDGSRFSKILFISGGMGAGRGHDGLSATCFPSNVVCGAMESIEASAPLRVWRKELSPDSGGAGEFRGGLGQEVEVELLGCRECVLSLFVERTRHPARGVLGGLPGAPARVELNGRTEGFKLKGRNLARPGDRLRIRYPGGGGYGPPSERSPEAVRADVEAGLVAAPSEVLHADA
jgi:N-methylhydantoinase B